MTYNLRLLFFNVLLLYISSCQEKNTTYISDPDKPFLAEKYITSYYTNVDSSISYSGNKSVKLSQSNPFGLSLSLHKPKAGEIYTAFLFRHNSNQHVKIAVSNNKDFYKDEIRKDLEENGWERISIQFQIPNNFQDDTVSVFAYNTTANAGWVDNMTIIKHVASDFTINNHTVYDIFYEAYHHYYLETYKELSENQLESDFFTKLLMKYCHQKWIDYSLFKETLKKTIFNQGYNRFLKSLEQHKSLSLYATVDFKLEEEMNSNALGMYTDKIVYELKDTIYITFEQRHKSVKILFDKLIIPYKFENKYSHLFYTEENNTVKIAVRNLDAGFYRLSASNHHGNFSAPIHYSKS